MFPEIDYDKIDKVRGLEHQRSRPRLAPNEEGLALLKAVLLPLPRAERSGKGSVDGQEVSMIEREKQAHQDWRLRFAEKRAKLKAIINVIARNVSDEERWDAQLQSSVAAPGFESPVRGQNRCGRDRSARTRVYRKFGLCPQQASRNAAMARCMCPGLVKASW